MVFSICLSIYLCYTFVLDVCDVFVYISIMGSYFIYYGNPIYYRRKISNKKKQKDKGNRTKFKDGIKTILFYLQTSGSSQKITVSDAVILDYRDFTEVCGAF